MSILFIIFVYLHHVLSLIFQNAMKFANYVLPVAILLTSYTAAWAQPQSFIEFNGTDQYVEIPSHSDFDITADKSFSITCWVSVDDLINGQRFVSRRVMGESSQTTGYEMWGGGSSSQYYAVNTPIPGGGNIFSDWCRAGSGTTGTWMHLAMVIDRSTNMVTLYRDGVQGNQKQNSALNTWTVVNNNDIYLGCCYNVTSRDVEHLMDGKLGNVRFWNKALTAAEVAADMDATVGPDTEGLIAAYDFANISGLTVPDLSGHGHDGTLSGFDPVGSDLSLYSVTSKADTNFTGRGNTNEIASSMVVAITGQGDNSYTFGNLSLDLTGTTNVQDIAAIKVYMTDQNSFDSRNVSGAQLLGTCVPEGNTVECTLDGSSPVGTKYLWLTFDVAENAAEGNVIAIKPTMLDTKAVSNMTTGSREILLGRKLLFAPGDYGSVAYRIPGIITAWDGSLVAVTDKRKYNQGDIPEDIDIVVRRSTDNGKTWSDPVTMAQGTGVGHGYGDAAIVRTNTENELLCIFIGGNGLFASTTSNRIRTYISRSTDNGQSWSAPEDITDQLFSGERASWTASFCAAGNGLKTRNGVLMFVAAMRHDSGSTLYNHVVYSNDNGETWNVSNCAMVGGDESKVVELNDGHILMSIRRQSKGARYYTISDNVPSKTEPVSWTQKTTSTVDSWAEMIEPACNGDIVRYTSTLDGYDKDRILHTVPNHATERQNVSLFLSYDEGETWPVKKTLCATGSAYSSIAILEDGTIGVYVEENYNTTDYSTYFLNVSLDWLTDNADTYTEPSGMEAVATPVFSLESGYYTEEQTLTITTETEDAQIYYTLDDTTPTTESTLYEGPITLNETVTVKAIAVKEGMSNSVMASATYTFLSGWEQPTGTIHATENRYVTSATTTDAVENLNYTQSSKPSTVFIDTQAPFTVEAGQTFSLRVQCTTAMIWCHAVLFADWNRDYDFNDEGEMIERVGKEPFEDSNLSSNGNTMMKDFSVDITVPADAKIAETRLRIQFTDAWHKKDEQGHTHTAMDAIDKGGCYDFVMNIVEPAPVDLAVLTLNSPANGTIEVRYAGEDALLNNNDEIIVGEQVEITLIPDENYQVASLMVNSVDRTADVVDNKLTVDVPAESLDIEAEFEDIPSAIDGNRAAQMTVYPTMFTSEINLNSTAAGEACVYDLAGRLLKRVAVSEGENRIEANTLPAGSMILVVTTDEGSKSFRVVKK